MKPGLLATLLTAAIVAQMGSMMAAVIWLALAVPLDAVPLVWIAAASLVVIDVILVLLIRRLVRELVLAWREKRDEGREVPPILIGLFLLYTFVLWTFLAPTYSWVAQVAGWRRVVEGLREPETRLVNNAIIMAFVLFSYWLFVGRFDWERVKAWWRGRQGGAH